LLVRALPVLVMLSCSASAFADGMRLAYRFEPGRELQYRAVIEIDPAGRTETPKSIEIVFGLSTTGAAGDDATLALALHQVSLSYPGRKLNWRLTYDIPGDTWRLNGIPLEGPPFQGESDRELFRQIGAVFKKPLGIDITSTGTISNVSSATSFGDLVSRSNVRDVLELLLLPALPQKPTTEGAKWTRLRRMEGPSGNELAVRTDYTLSHFNRTEDGSDAVIDFVASATSRLEQLPTGRTGGELVVFFVLEGHGRIKVDIERGVLSTSVMEVESSFEVQTTQPGTPLGIRRLKSLWKYSLSLETSPDPEATYK